MRIVDQQATFLKHCAMLILAVEKFGLTCTAGELFRTEEQQQIHIKTGASKKKHSLHQDRMAVDLNFFKNGVLTYKKEDIQPIGDYWESLDPNNKWGGNWTELVDTPHFQRNIININQVYFL